MRLDVALLQASAPLLSLRADGGVASALTTTSNTIDLTSRAKLNATAPVIALDGSRLTVNNASVVNVAGGSYLGVTGNLLSVANGSRSRFPAARCCSRRAAPWSTSAARSSPSAEPAAR